VPSYLEMRFAHIFVLGEWLAVVGRVYRVDEPIFRRTIINSRNDAAIPPVLIYGGVTVVRLRTFRKRMAG
jgi:hypothetical protein